MIFATAKLSAECQRNSDVSCGGYWLVYLSSTVGGILVKKLYVVEPHSNPLRIVRIWGRELKEKDNLRTVENLGTLVDCDLGTLVDFDWGGA
ncbi:hypothetical protein PHJA_000850800 [Phtheirospermum japonicum]|uniref:Uncharacterized protein n=1 Tax=Phtheirospermum japonicum TaxID=374723 RepID=A0A830BHL4_9LAMI|nr:hypothetical protein PHJA_000850800 [Phtheirospermum japonicum]